MISEFVMAGGKKLRMGITTGTCAALAAQGAVRMLLTGKILEEACLVTPKGIRVLEPLLYSSIRSDAASCAVRKDAGDDRDATDGILIYARAEIPHADGVGDGDIIIEGGEGIGRVTLPGLDQPVGAAAINSVPRRMIREAALDAAAALGYEGPVKITIYAPEGSEIAKKTFNPRLGIEGGISILGTSGIVEPMSLSALISSIAVEIRQKAAMGCAGLILTPGNYGLSYLEEWSAQNGISALHVPVVVCSNFIGDAIDCAREEGIEDILLVGHIGKLVKIAGGIMNTHSRTADCRMEIITAHAACCGAEPSICRELMKAATTDACITILQRTGLYEAVMAEIMTSVREHLKHRAEGRCHVGAILFSNVCGFIGSTEEARQIIDRWKS